MWSRDALERVLSGLITKPGRRPHPYRRAQHRHHADDGGAAPNLRPRTAGAVAERIGAVVFASPDIDMDVFSSSVRAHRPARGEDHRRHRDQRPRARRVAMDRRRDHPRRRRRARRSSSGWGCA